MDVMLRPFLSPPVQVTAFAAPLGYSAPLQGEAQGTQYLPFQFGGNWYQAIMGDQSGTNPNPNVVVYHSADGGATWTPGASAGAPVFTVADSGPAAVALVGNHVCVAYTANGNLNTGATDNVRIKMYNLNTGIWGAAVPGGPLAVITLQLFSRPDGSLLLIYISAIGPIALSAAVFSGGAWGLPFRIDTNLPAGYDAVVYAQGVLDPSGTAHVIFPGNNAVAQLTNLYEQQILPSNALGSFSDITVWQLPSPGGSLGSLFNSSPIILNNSILVGLQGSSTGDLSQPDYVTLAIGTPLNAPVWTVGAAPGIDGLTDPDFAEQSLSIATDGQAIYAAYVVNSGATWQLRLLATQNLSNPLTGWTSILAFDTGAAGVQNSINYLGIGVQNGQLFGTAVIPLAPASGPQQFWLGAQAVGAAFAADPGSIIPAQLLPLIPLPDPGRC